MSNVNETPANSIAAQPCVEIDGHIIIVDMKITPDNVRVLGNHREPVSSEEAQKVLEKLWKTNMKSVKSALTEYWANESDTNVANVIS
jgi:hypothetical protein